MPAFDAAGGLLGAGGVEDRVAVEQPHDVAAALGGLDDEPGPHRVGQRLAVVADRAVDDLDVGVGRSARTNAASWRLGDDDVGVREQLDGAHGQQPGVAGAGPDEGDGAQRWPAWLELLDRRGRAVLLMVVFFFSVGRVTGRAPTSGRPHPRRAARPRGRGRAVLPRREVRWRTAARCAEPSSATTAARRYSSGTCSPSGRLAVGPDRGRAAGLQSGEQGALGGHGEPGGGVVERAEQVGRSVSGSSSSALDRQRALAGGGQHLDRVDDLGDGVEPAEPGQPGAGEHDGVELAVARPGASRVSTLPRTATTSRPRPSARSWAARRGEPVPTREPAGSSPRVSPSRATSASRGSSRGGTAASTMPLGRGGRQVLERVHGEVDRRRRAAPRAAR